MSDNVGRLIKRAKNHPVLSVVILLGVMLSGVEAATNALSTLVNAAINLSGARESPRLIQFAIVKNKTAYRESSEFLFAAGPQVKSYMPDIHLAVALHSYPVFQVSIENPNDTDMVVTDIRYRVSDVGGVRGGEPGVLEASYQYQHELKYEKGTQTQQLVPPFKIPPKSAGAFELVLYTTHEDIGLMWLMSVEFVTNRGSVTTDEFQLLLSGNPSWAHGMFRK